MVPTAMLKVGCGWVLASGWGGAGQDHHTDGAVRVAASQAGAGQEIAESSPVDRRLTAAAPTQGDCDPFVTSTAKGRE